MPNVASDTKAYAAKAWPQVAVRPLPVSVRPLADRPPAAPFETLLDDSTPAPPPPPARNAAHDDAPRADRPEPPARARNTDAAKDGNARKAGDKTNSDGKSAAGDAGKTENAGKAKPASDGKAADAKTTDQAATDDDEPVADAKPTDAKPTDAKPADGQVLTVATAMPAAAIDPVSPAIDAIAALAPAAVAQAPSPVENPASLLAAAQPETGAALQAGAATLADGETLDAKLAAKSSAKIDAKIDTKSDTKTDAKSDTKATNKSAAPAQATVTPQGDADKPDDAAKPLDADKADKNAATRARGEAAVKDNRAAAIDTPDKNADGNAAPKFNADVALPSPLTAPAHANSLQAVGAPAAPPMAPATAAIPLASIAIEIAGKALAGKNHFEIRLDPPELGRIEVRLEVDRDGNVTSRMIADRQDTLDLLRRDASGLERALQDAGLKTGDNGMQFSLRDHTAGQQHSDGGANMARLVAQDDTLGAAEILPSGYSRLAGQGSGIDIHV